jgi:tetratricopeptide (TPR) repeat protein
MKNIQTIALALMLLLLMACENATKRAAEITVIEDQVKQEAIAGKVDTAHIARLIDLYQKYVASYPQDSLCPSYLMRSGEFFRNAMLPQQALSCYERVSRDYPQYRKRNMALFLTGFIYENELHDMNKAKSCYEQYLTQYPNTAMAKDAKFSLDNLGKTPEQLLEEMAHKQEAASTDSSAH